MKKLYRVISDIQRLFKHLPPDLVQYVVFQLHPDDYPEVTAQLRKDIMEREPTRRWITEGDDQRILGVRLVEHPSAPRLRGIFDEKAQGV